MKNFTLLLVALVFAFAAQAQTPAAGDYRTAFTAGNWEDASTWEISNGMGGWSAALAAPGSTNNVYIQNNAVVSVNTALVNCNDLQLNLGGSLVVDVNAVNVNGKLRAYSGTEVMGATDGIFYSGQASVTTGFVTAMATTTGTGAIQIGGNSRTVFNTGEWGGSGFSGCNINFKLNAGQIANADASFKFANVLVTSGTLNAASSCRIGADDGNGTGSITIKTGATIVSSRNGTASQVFSANSTTKFGTLTIESGGTLELTGTAPAIDATTIVNNGTISYTKGGSQTLLQPGTATGSTNIDTYSTLILSTSGTKTLANAISISTLFQFNGIAALANSSANSVTMLSGSTIERNTTSGTTIPSSVPVIFGTAATDLVNISIGANVNNTGELPSAPGPGAVGKVTVKSGAVYTLTGGRTITDLDLKGNLALVPSSTLTLTLNGNISGVGAVVGNANASIVLQGVNDNDGGTLNFASGNRVANSLTVNRTGTNASITLGTPVTLSGNLNLTAGTLIGGGNLITVPGNISGSGACTATGSGKVLLTGNVGVASLSSAAIDNLELNSTNNFTLSGSTNINGTLTLTAGTLFVPSNRTLNINSGNAIGGAPFSTSKYIILEKSAPDVGKVSAKNISFPVLYPVGTPAYYMPVTLNPSSPMDFSINVFEGATQEGTADGTPVDAIPKASIVDAVYTINRQNGTGTCEVTLGWNQALEGSVFTTLPDNQIGISHYNGTMYENAIGTGDNTNNSATATFSDFSPFIVSKTGMVLPVNLTGISAKFVSTGAVVTWDVQNESSVSKYEVERSYDGQNFSAVGSVNAASRNHYSFTDNSLQQAKKVYYRLKIVNVDGRITYSNIVILKAAGNIKVDIYPNPVSNTLSVSGIEGKNTLRIRDAAGRLVLSINTSANTQTIDVSRLAKGNYTLQVINENLNSASTGFIKL